MRSMVIYLAAPNCVRQTDRYEQYYYLLSHHFKNATILEARELFPGPRPWKQEEWTASLGSIDALVFLRNEEKYIGLGTWKEICEVRKAGKTIYLACTDPEGKLVLASWDEIYYKFGKNQRNYVLISTGAASAQRNASKWHHDNDSYMSVQSKKPQPTIKQKIVDAPVIYKPPSAFDLLGEEYARIMATPESQNTGVRYGLLRVQGGKLQRTPDSLVKREVKIL